MKRFAKYVVALALVFGSVYGLGMIYIARAQAIPPGMGCETVDWGFLGYQNRTICDGPRRADGSWSRVRVIWTPAGYVRGYCGTYSCYSGYYRDESIQGREEYVVFDSNVLPDEPPWLPLGTNTIR